MFPIKYLVDRERFAFITYLIIAVNIIIFYCCNYVLTSDLYLIDFGLVPSKLGMPFDIVPFYEMMYPFITYQFIHAGYFHLIINLYFIFIFGRAVESRLGHRSFLFAYIAFGIAGAVVQVLSDTSSTLPIIGASGSVAGILGAAIVLYPRSQVKTLFVIIVFIFVRNVPLFVYIVVWLLIQLIAIYIELGFHDAEIALYDHLGGFVSGVLIAMLIAFRGRGKIKVNDTEIGS